MKIEGIEQGELHSAKRLCSKL